MGCGIWLALADVFGKLSSASSLLTVNLRCNYLSGQLSEDLGSCASLTSLNCEGKLGVEAVMLVTSRETDVLPDAFCRRESDYRTARVDDRAH